MKFCGLVLLSLNVAFPPELHICLPAIRKSINGTGDTFNGRKYCRSFTKLWRIF